MIQNSIARRSAEPRSPSVHQGACTTLLGLSLSNGCAVPVRHEHTRSTSRLKADDGILVFDHNGTVAPVAKWATEGDERGIGEMFGSATQDGFEVLETLDTNHDGKGTLFARLRHDSLARLRHDTADADFASLRVWQDANEDGISDAGELKTLAELRRMQGRLLVGNRRLDQRIGHPKAHEGAIASISVNRTDVAGTNEGHDRGFAATFTRTDGSTGFQAPNLRCPPSSVQTWISKSDV